MRASDFLLTGLPAGDQVPLQHPQAAPDVVAQAYPLALAEWEGMVVVVAAPITLQADRVVLAAGLVDAAPHLQRNLAETALSSWNGNSSSRSNLNDNLCA